jgi:hypothetical protein
MMTIPLAAEGAVPENSDELLWTAAALLIPNSDLDVPHESEPTFDAILDALSRHQV